MILLNNNYLIDPSMVMVAQKDTWRSGEYPFQERDQLHYHIKLKMRDGEKLKVFYYGGETEESSKAAGELMDKEFQMIYDSSNSY